MGLGVQESYTPQTGEGLACKLLDWKVHKPKHSRLQWRCRCAVGCLRRWKAGEGFSRTVIFSHSLSLCGTLVVSYTPARTSDMLC
jgi:hypothetical protein